MAKSTTPLLPLIGALALALALPVAAEPLRGTAAGGVAFVSGGASDEELATLRTERRLYSFWLTTAARGSGGQSQGQRQGADQGQKRGG